MKNHEEVTRLTKQIRELEAIRDHVIKAGPSEEMSSICDRVDLLLDEAMASNGLKMRL
ncbi:MAG: hypothetical protein POH28_11570 [Acidocella sp.]|nr:hypothetical protein [Acidocella sp.]